MDVRRRNALIAVILLIVVPAALIFAWRALRGPDVLVSFLRSGGLAGATDELTVYGDGRAVVSRVESTTERELSEDELGALLDVLEEGQWPAEFTTYGRPMPDEFQIDIAYDGHSVRAYSAETPPWLVTVIAALDQIVSEVGG